MAEAARPGLLAIALRLGFVLSFLASALELGSRTFLRRQAEGWSLPISMIPLGRLLNFYLEARHWVLANQGRVFLVVCAAAGAVVGVRKLLGVFYRWREKVTGFDFSQERYDFPKLEFELTEFIGGNPKPESQIFLGLDEKARPVYLTDRDRSMHVQCLGQTGSGKTASVIVPMMLQDMLRGRGVLFLDGKGSRENHEQFVALAETANRANQVKILTLIPGWKSHTINLVHLRSDADPKAVAQRVFSSFVEDMDNPYYRDQSAMFFDALVRLFAATGRPFCLNDLAAAVTSPEALSDAMTRSSDGPARKELENICNGLGREYRKTFSGLLAALARFNVPVLNAYTPDIVLEDEVEKGGLLACFLPTNLYKQLARYVGIVMLQHVQYVGALRQTGLRREQPPYYVYVDEVYSFAYEYLTEALNKLRDAGISVLLSHQSMSDLEKVSKEFANGVWDNTRNKVILYQNHPETCERVAKTVGTKKGVELTVRRSADGLLTAHSTLEASSREVDAYLLHPGKLKSLRIGQGYLIRDSLSTPVCFKDLEEM